MGKSLMSSFFTHIVYGLWGCESRPISFRDDKTWLSFFVCSTSEVTTLWRYTNVFIIIIIFADSCLVLLYKVLFLQCCAKRLTERNGWDELFCVDCGIKRFLSQWQCPAFTMSASWIASWWTAAEYSSSGCSSFSDLMLLVGQHERYPAYKKTGWWGAGIVIYLERGTELYTAQLMPLPLTFSCLNNVQIGFTYRLTWVVPDKGQLNGRVCVRCCCSCCCCCSCSLCFCLLYDTATNAAIIRVLCAHCRHCRCQLLIILCCWGNITMSHRTVVDGIRWTTQRRYAGIVLKKIWKVLVCSECLFWLSLE